MFSPASFRQRQAFNRLMPALIVAGLLAWCSTGFSQPLKPSVGASSPTGGSAHVATAARPTWPELTLPQQQALAPLAASWSTISEAQKRKWLEISKNYSALPPEDQATLNSRMNEWVRLTPQQRAQARLNFGKTKELSKQLTAEEKNAQWQAYQALSPEEKQKLAAKASPKPAGAATAVKPVAPQKLVMTPASTIKPTSKPTLKIEAPLPAATSPKADAPSVQAAPDAATSPPQR